MLGHHLAKEYLEITSKYAMHIKGTEFHRCG